MHQLLILAATLLLSTTASAFTTFAFPQPTQSCMSGAHIIVARASLEEQGEGIIGAVASQIVKSIPSSDSVAVVYPATESDYVQSEQEGVVGMKQLVTGYVDKCPGNKIILMGYSQGAQVVGDTVIGAEDNNFSNDQTNPTGLGTQYLDAIAAMIMMGDPAFNTSDPGKVGNASQSGIFARQNVDAFSQYNLNDKMQTYCDAGDTYCANGGSGNQGLQIHLGYVSEYGSQAASFAVSKFSASATATAASSASSASSAATTSKGGSGSSMSVGSSSAAMTQAASSASQSSSGAAAGGNDAYLTSQRFTPVTTTHTGTYTQPGNLANVGGIHTMEKGVAGTVFGVAMFVMGIL